MAASGRPAPDDLTDDPGELANAARLHLREKFLRAKVGVSGANFAVAETGTLVVVESEGNGRMCLTLPEVLVSVVGIEKVVPTFADLDVFLRLLPRSSTGERMNPYTSMWHGVTPGDGPQEVHVVLLDNGRTRALADRVGRQALRCIRCSACLNVCPVYERVGGHAYGSVYPGPIGAILTPLLRGVGERPAGRLAAVRLHPVRCLLRRVPGEDRHPVGAGRPPHPGRRRAPRRPPHGGGGRHEVGCPGFLPTPVGSHAPSGSRAAPAGGGRGWPGCPGRVGAGRLPATCPRRPASPSVPGGGGPGR